MKGVELLQINAEDNKKRGLAPPLFKIVLYT